MSFFKTLIDDFQIKLSLFAVSFLRTFVYNTTYVCYFLFPVLAIDQYLYVCQNFELKANTIKIIIGVCFAIPLLVAGYDLFLQHVVIYDFMFAIVKMSIWSNMVSFFLNL